MIDYSDHTEVKELLQLSQDGEEERRSQVRQEREFLLPIEGAQWDQDLWLQMGDAKRPRYEFDITSPVIKLIADDLEQKDFSIDVSPASGDASKDVAGHLDGLIRTLENVSNAQMVYNQASKMVVIGGIDGWEIVQAYADADSFDQDLLIRPIYNFVDRVWFDHAMEMQDASDARHVFKLTSIPAKDFEDKYKRPGKSLSTDRTKTSLMKQKDVVVCGEIYYIKKTDRTLGLFSDGSVYDITSEDYLKVRDELQEAGITLQKTRKRPKAQVFIRKFDAHGWIGDAQATVFGMLPIIPMFGNYEVYDNHVLYRGEVAKLMHPQKIFNYAKSREIEEGALAPRKKWMMTPEQMAGHEQSLSTMNVNSDPVQAYNHVDGHTPPYESGGAQINPQLQNLSNSMRDVILGASGQFAAAQGDNPGLQSGVAIEKLQQKSDAGASGYVRAREVAQTRTAQVMIDAIPKLYDTPRMVKIMQEDGSYEMVTLHTPIYDDETGEVVELIDFSKGIYDVVCTAGPGFKSRQDETVNTLTAIGQVVPGAIEMNSDIVMNAVNAPGMKEAAARQRRALLMQGAIPEEQMTDEEKAMLQERAQQQQEPDAMMVAAQAEMEKANAAKEKNQIEFARAEAQLAERALKVQQAEAKLMQDDFKMQMQAAKEAHQREMEQIKAAYTQAQTQGQYLDNQIKLEELNNMPMAKLLELANGAKQLQVIDGGRADPS